MGRKWESCQGETVVSHKSFNYTELFEIRQNNTFCLCPLYTVIDKNNPVPNSEVMLCLLCGTIVASLDVVVFFPLLLNISHEIWIELTLTYSNCPWQSQQLRSLPDLSQLAHGLPSATGIGQGWPHHGKTRLFPWIQIRETGRDGASLYKRA